MAELITDSKMGKQKNKKQKEPLYLIDGFEYTLKSYGDLKLGETKIIDSLLAIKKNEDDQMELNTASPVDIFKIILIPKDRKTAPPEINYDALSLNEMMQLTAQITVDFVLERESFLAGMPRQMKSLGRQKAKQKLRT